MQIAEAHRQFIDEPSPIDIPDEYVQAMNQAVTAIRERQAAEQKEAS